jgi:hypothetical protein
MEAVLAAGPKKEISMNRPDRQGLHGPKAV